MTDKQQWTCSNCGATANVDPSLPVFCVCQMATYKDATQSAVESLPEESRRLLIGDRIKQLTDALGIPQCNGCASRQAWLNRAHAWVIQKWA